MEFFQRTFPFPPDLLLRIFPTRFQPGGKRRLVQKIALYFHAEAPFEVIAFPFLLQTLMEYFVG